MLEPGLQEDGRDSDAISLRRTHSTCAPCFHGGVLPRVGNERPGDYANHWSQVTEVFPRLLTYTRRECEGSHGRGGDDAPKDTEATGTGGLIKLPSQSVHPTTY